MNADAALADLARLAGIFPEFHDLGGVLRPTSVETQRALLRADGLPADTDGQAADTLAALKAEIAQAFLPRDLIVRSGAVATVDLAEGTQWSLTDETGQPLAEGRSTGQITLPALPSGVHRLDLALQDRHQRVNLIAAPARTPSLQELTGRDRIWGGMAALYGLRSERNGGLGDFRDLGDLAQVLGQAGAGFLGINPVHALGWGDLHTISPYSPTHRGFLNPMHIAVDALPWGEATQPGPRGQDALIDYPLQYHRKRDALRRRFDGFMAESTGEERKAFADFEAAGGTALADFARFEAVSILKGPDWRHWQQATDASAPRAEVDFHLWLQWTADRQLAQAQQLATSSGMGLGLYLDLAVGARLGGAESWGARSSLAQGVSLGAPPDQLSPAGQNWQLAAYAPRGLGAAAYAPLRQVLRQVLRHCGILRIDHALGLNRSYWLPEDGSPGGYIRQPFQALMAIIAIEAERAKALIVGEDLGLVPDGFRETMADAGLYGYTVLQYEKHHDGHFRQPQELRPRSLACFGTHDTPTLRGFREGHDIDWWQKLGWTDADAAAAARAQRTRETAELTATAQGAQEMLSPEEVAAEIHGALAASPCALVAVQLDDILNIREAQNLPGTIDEHPNWRRRYPMCAQDIALQNTLTPTAEIMARAGRGAPPQDTEKDT